MKRIVLITVHHWQSKKRAGFHWLADAYNRNGAEVLFFTCPVSTLSVVSRDERIKCGILAKRNKIIEERKGLFSYAWFTPWHPANLWLNFLNSLSARLFRRYGNFPFGEAESFLRSADMIIIESCAGLMLFSHLKQINPNARFVYRVSDDLRLLNSHPVIIQAEKDYAEKFDLVSVPNSHMLELFDASAVNVKLQLHGINKQVFDLDCENPYKDSKGPNLVFVGVSMLDTDFIERASRLFPDWNFHIIGPLSGFAERPNIRTYGELKFVDTIPFIKHADVGLATRSYTVGAESLGDSLKVIQYSYCKLPVSYTHLTLPTN
jgi:2-beta-glucuronyltransferase